MVIKYTNSKEDYLEYHMFLYSFSGQKKQDVKQTRIMYFIFAGLLGLFAVFSFIAYFRDKVNNINSLSTGLSYVFVCIITVGFAFLAGAFRTTIEKVAYKRVQKKSNKVIKETVVTIDDKGITYSGEVEGFVKATEKKQLKETKNLYIIVMRKNSLAIPKEKIEDVTLFKKMLHAEEI